MADEERKFPDALRVPLNWRGTSDDKFVRANTLMDACEPLLGVGPGGAHARIQGHANEVYVSKKPGDDPMLFRSDHPTMPKQPRYKWVEMTTLGPGVFYGYLTPEALLHSDDFDPAKRAEIEAGWKKRFQARGEHAMKWGAIMAKPEGARTAEEREFLTKPFVLGE